MIDGQLMGPFAQSEQLRPVGHCSHVVIFVKIYCLHVANNICAATPWSYHLTFFVHRVGHSEIMHQLTKSEAKFPLYGATLNSSFSVILEGIGQVSVFKIFLSSWPLRC